MHYAEATVNEFYRKHLVRCWRSRRAGSWLPSCKRHIPHDPYVAIERPSAGESGAHARSGDRLPGLNLWLAGSNHLYTVAAIVRSGETRTGASRHLGSTRDGRTPRE